MTVTERYDPYWVRLLVETIGHELHDTDRLAKPSGLHTEFARGMEEGFRTAAQYLERSTRQAVARLGLTEVLEGARAGLDQAKLAAIPQRVAEEA